MENHLSNTTADANTTEFAAPTYSSDSAATYSAEEITSLEPTIEEKCAELRQRVDHLLVTLSSFVSCFVFFGGIALLGAYSNPEAFGTSSMPLTAAQFALIFGTMFGYMVSSIIGAIMLAVRFFSIRTRLFKILAAVFFMITYMCVAFIGIYGNIPYQIYNIVKIIGLKKNISSAEKAE